jgi:hypothetical protein
MITVRVGQARKTKDFVAPRSFLTTRSEFIRRAMNGSWKEAATRIVKLPEDNPETFAIYINFVYSGQLSTATKTSGELEIMNSDEASNEIRKEHRTLFQVYVLAEKLQDVAIKNATVEATLALSQLLDRNRQWTVPAWHTINIVYDGTLPNNPARRFVTDLWTSLDINSIFRNFLNLNKEFLDDLGDSMSKSRLVTLGNMAEKNGIAAYLETPEEK